MGVSHSAPDQRLLADVAALRVSCTKLQTDVAALRVSCTQLQTQAAVLQAQVLQLTQITAQHHAMLQGPSSGASPVR